MGITNFFFSNLFQYFFTFPAKWDSIICTIHASPYSAKYITQPLNNLGTYFTTPIQSTQPLPVSLSPLPLIVQYTLYPGNQARLHLPHPECPTYPLDFRNSLICTYVGHYHVCLSFPTANSIRSHPHHRLKTTPSLQLL